MHLGRVITSPRCTVGRVNPSSSAFYQSKGRVDRSLDEPMQPSAGGSTPSDPLPVSLLSLTVTLLVADTHLIFIGALPQVNKSSHTIILQCVTANFYPVDYVFIVSRKRCVYKYPSLYPANRQHKQDLTPTPLYSHDMYPLFHQCKITHTHYFIIIIIKNTNYPPTTYSSPPNLNVSSHFIPGSY